MYSLDGWTGAEALGEDGVRGGESCEEADLYASNAASRV